ncbi:GntP family permease [Rhodocaloribacter litoris]|uniref:GntP family permease n=1 Tax=Rhodocaloribacter litoris TaxID=2558931 RepID=UPI001E3C31F8|nr:SLC13 family permease [Rhodocaloribacter litoris]QXD15913.1 GntP family permease [Rhodocaloribacter litoris]
MDLTISPLLILLVGLVTVIGLIVVLRINAFFALIAAALVVSLLAPGALADKVVRVARAFGDTAGSIGIVIALAAVIGQCMMESGAADRIVRWFLDRLGEQRSATALLSSGFVLSVPVFFDTVFYLLIPLARSMYRRTRRHYLIYVMAIAGGSAVTHAMVPPTPGPLVIADNLGVDLGLMMLLGLAVGVPAALAGLFFARWLDPRLNVPFRPISDRPEPEPLPADRLPPLSLSVLPILLPVVLISANTVIQGFAGGAATGSGLAFVAGWAAVAGNPNLALLLAAGLSLWVYHRQCRPTRQQTTALVESALMSGGLIILITAGGGAFGAMLKEAQIGPAIQALFAGETGASGLFLLVLAFGIASLLKFAQGSSTVAMITASAMIAAMLTAEAPGYNLVYLALAVSCGSLVGSWMNDSGFWIYAKMGGLTEVETLKSWTPLLAVLGLAGFAVTVLLALLLPLG